MTTGMDLDELRAMGEEMERRGGVCVNAGALMAQAAINLAAARTRIAALTALVAALDAQTRANVTGGFAACRAADVAVAAARRAVEALA